VSRVRFLASAAWLLAVVACQTARPAALYETIPVERRDIVVAATGTGMIEPTLTLNVKSKAWGEILELAVQTGDEVQKGHLLAKIDPRIPQDNLTQAQANRDRAQAQLETATAQLKRSEALYRSQSIAETDLDSARLAAATAKAALVTATAVLQTAQDAMEDTHVGAPITGTILELDAVLGTVISSPNLGGGTVILKMANIDTVEDSVLVSETDIGRVQPGLPATLTVDAYRDRAFEGSVRMIKPEAQVYQNVTMFPVLISVPNPGHLLKPGMNTEVMIHIGQRRGVLAVPNAALRTARDVGSAANVLGLDPQVVQQELAAQAAVAPARAARDSAVPRDTSKRSATDTGAAGATYTTPSGRTIALPPGVTPAQVQAAIATMRSGGTPSPADRALLGRVFAQAGRGGGGVGGGGGAGGAGGGAGRQPRSGYSASYIVFVRRQGQILPVPITAGLTDQEFMEVQSGLTDKDSVLVLPSASLVQAQQQFRQRFQNVTGGGLPGLRQQQPQTSQPRTP
jgi:HlyD family secretion protein